MGNKAKALNIDNNAINRDRGEASARHVAYPGHSGREPQGNKHLSMNIFIVIM
jgi:hypothetical protein